MRRSVTAISLTIALAGIGLAPAAAQSRAPLVLTAPAAPGGGWDQTARAMQRVLNTIDPVSSVQVDNVPGAAGTIGLARFIQSERGNADALMITGLVMVSGVVTNASPVSLADVTPVARLTGEYEVIVVPASSRFATLSQLVEAFRADPGAISWGGGSAGGTDDLLVRLLAEQVGVPASKVNYVAFAGGGAALAGVLGGQLSAAVSGYAEFAGQIEAGQLRVLAVSAPSRVTGIDAPTIRDAGIPLDLANWRGIVAPPGISDGAQRAIVERLAQMHASAEWQAALKQNGWDDLFLTGPPFKQFLLAEQARITDVLHRLSAGEAAATPARAFITPTTLPYATAGLLALTLIAAIVTRATWIAIVDRTALGAAFAGLLMFPLLMATAGFVVAATLAFVGTAVAFRPAPRRPSAADWLVGVTFAAVVFIVFTRALGVSLPAGPGF